MTYNKSNKSLVVFGYNPWSEYWKRNQIISFLLSKSKIFKKIYFINPALWPNEIFNNNSSKSYYITFKKRYILPRKTASNIIVWTPIIFPKTSFLYNIIFHLIFNKYSNLIPIFLINNPYYYILFKKFFKHQQRIIFDWSDDFEMFATTETDRQLISNAVNSILYISRAVICVNKFLLLRSLKINKNSYLISNKSALNLKLNFPKNNSILKIELFTKLHNLNRPIVGYVGWILKSRIDTNLVAYIAKRLPHISFVFIGPSPEFFTLHSLTSSYPNIYIFPPVSYMYLKDLIQIFDICILPNLINDYTRGNDPIKIYDYLISKKPVVSTRTAGVDSVKDYIFIEDNYKSFLNRIMLLSTQNNFNFLNNKTDKFSWDSNIDSIYSIFDKFSQ